MFYSLIIVAAGASVLCCGAWLHGFYAEDVHEDVSALVVGGTGGSASIARVALGAHRERKMVTRGAIVFTLICLP
jgi:hypothetical protein